MLRKGPGQVFIIRGEARRLMNESCLGGAQKPVGSPPALRCRSCLSVSHHIHSHDHGPCPGQGCEGVCLQRNCLHCLRLSHSVCNYGNWGALLCSDTGTKPKQAYLTTTLSWSSHPFTHARHMHKVRYIVCPVIDDPYYTIRMSH